jgi:hypothetical protein
VGFILNAHNAFAVRFIFNAHNAFAVRFIAPQIEPRGNPSGRNLQGGLVEFSFSWYEIG